MPINVDVVPESTYTVARQESARIFWLGLFSGPASYALYFIVGYLLSEATCQQDLFAINPANLAPVIGILTGLALVATLFFTALSYRNWRNYCRQNDAIGEALAFMAFGGLLLNGLFTLLIVVTGFAVFLIDLCRWI